MLCVLILYTSGRTYSLKSTPNDKFFEKLFMTVFIYSQSFCQKSAERNRRRNTFRILFWRLAWGSNPGFSSNKPTHYLLDHGDFKPLTGLEDKNLIPRVKFGKLSVMVWGCTSSKGVGVIGILNEIMTKEVYWPG